MTKMLLALLASYILHVAWSSDSLFLAAVLILVGSFMLAEAVSFVRTKDDEVLALRIAWNKVHGKSYEQYITPVIKELLSTKEEHAKSNS